MNYQVEKTSFNNTLDFETHTNINNTVKLDRVMLKVSLDALNSFNEQLFFVKCTSSGQILEYTYDSKNHKYMYQNLWIKIDLRAQELVMNISSKCLLDRYKESISANNISDVMQIIINQGIISFDVDYVIRNAIVMACDVVIDKKEKFDYIRLTDMKYSLNSKYWKLNYYNDGVCLIKTTAKGKPVGLSYTIYDKQTEIISKNGALLKHVSCVSDFLEDFLNTVRHEFKLNSIANIKKYLNISDTNLSTILNSLVRIDDILINKILKIDRVSLSSNKKITFFKIGKASLNDFKNHLFCHYCNYDVEKIRLMLQSMLSNKTNLSSAIKPYIDILKNPKFSMNVLQ